MRICQQLNKHVSQRALLPDPVWQSLSLSLGCSYNIYIPKKERKNIFVEYINFHIIKREKSVGLGNELTGSKDKEEEQEEEAT